MYRKDTALELQFPAARLNSGAGDPVWVDLSRAEAERLHAALGGYLQAASHALPLVVSLEDFTASAQVTTPAEAELEKTAAPPDEPRQWICVICGWIYDEATGDPEHGIAAGTRWEDVPEDFRCPLCDVGKSDFALVEF